MSTRTIIGLRLAHRLAADPLLDLHIRHERAWAFELDSVVEVPDLDPAALVAVVAMRDRVDDRLLPGEGGILGLLDEEEVVQPSRALDQTAQCLVRALDDTRQGALDARALVHVVSRAGLSLGAVDDEHAHVSVGMRDARRPGREKEHRAEAQVDVLSTAMREAPVEQVLNGLLRRIARRDRCLAQQLAIEITERHAEHSSSSTLWRRA